MVEHSSYGLWFSAGKTKTPSEDAKVRRALLLLPRRLWTLDFTVEELFKSIVSGGIVGIDLAAPLLPREIGLSGQTPLEAEVTRPAGQARDKAPIES